MSYFLLISDSQQDQWRNTLRESLAAIGQLESAQEDEAVRRIESMSYEAVIIDATVVRKVELLIKRILAQRAQTRVVVVTASPTWQLARAAFLAGAVEYIEKSSSRETLMASFKDILSKPPPQHS